MNPVNQHGEPLKSNDCLVTNSNMRILPFSSKRRGGKWKLLHIRVERFTWSAIEDEIGLRVII